MRGSSARSRVAACLALVALAACSSATRPGEPSRAPVPAGAPEDRIGPGGRLPYTDADIQFMSGMIPHHAQAVLIAGWAESHGASPDLRILTERMVVAQSDEIVTMQNWLQDRGQPVPPADATHHRMMMNGVEHDMLMPGMLNAEELAQLDRARGLAFDRLFLTFMIRHHEGALQMVDELFASPGAGQDDIVFKFASDVFADQSTEIERMQKMLAAREGGQP